MKRRSKVSQAAMGEREERAEKVQINETRGLVSPVTNKSLTLSIRLSGPWFALWERFRASKPKGVSDSELLRRAVVLYIALEAVDAKGNKPEALIRFHNEKGELVTANLKEYVGLREEETDE